MTLSKTSKEERHNATKTQMAAPPASAVVLSNAEILRLLGHRKSRFERNSQFALPNAEREATGFKGREFAAIPATKIAETWISESSNAEVSGSNYSETDMAVSEPSETTNAPDNLNTSVFQAHEPAAMLDIEAERREARAQGHAEALEEIERAKEEARQEALQMAKSEAERSISEARDVFIAAATRLDTAASDTEGRLAKAIETAVHALASDRAGVEIDSSPQHFMARIEGIARAIASGSQSAVVEMHTDDLAAIEPYLSELNTLVDAQFTAGENLSRGDIRLTLGDIAFEDILNQCKPEAPA